MGSVTAPENIRWFVPFWLWLGVLVWGELAGLPFGVLLFTFFPSAFLSFVPFLCQRVGLLRWSVFVGLLPAVLAAAAAEGLRALLRLV